MAERDSIDSLPAGTLGQYRVRSRIGSGGMGDVFDAIHVTLDKRVAIKTLRRRYLEDEVVVARFLREGQLASRMRHPNIVDVTDVGVIDGLPCLVMEHLEGETLGQMIRRDGAMRPSALVDILLPIIAAVDFAHDHGVLHRDLKPSNIFLARSWNGEVHPKVLDFGISKLVHESTEAALTTDSAFVGTPHYASPESVRAEKAADRRSDQYSMGVILYEGTTGKRPYAESGGSFVTMAMAVCSGVYPAPRSHNPELPEAFERVIQRAMSLRADDRFLGMRQLGAALLPFASDRARVIWAPTFSGHSSPDGAVASPDTQVLGPSSGHTAIVPHSGSGSHSASHPGSHASQSSHPGSVRSQGPFSATGPVQGWPVAPMVHGAPSGSGPASGMPFMLGASGERPFVQMPMHDRTPSFGAGIGSSIAPTPAPTRSSTALITVAVLAVIGLGLIGVAVTRMSAKRAAATDSETSAPAATTFKVDVQVTPATAAVELDGAPLGSPSHLVKQLPRDGQQHVLRVSAPGYETLLIQFDDGRPPPSVIALRAGPAGVASTTLAGAPGSGHAGVKPPTTTGGQGNQGNPNRGPATNVPPGGKGKPERPRTDNIDPWE